jgi:hypothetical protein
LLRPGGPGEPLDCSPIRKAVCLQTASAGWSQLESFYEVALMNRLTSCGSNCVPAHLRSSANGNSWLRPLRLPSYHGF